MPGVLAELEEGEAVDVEEIDPRQDHQREAGAHDQELQQEHRDAASGEGEAVSQGGVLCPLAPPDGQTVEQRPHEKKLHQKVREHHGKEGGQVLQEGRVPAQELHAHGHQVDDRDEP